jgi:hypothetical protein
MTIRSRLLDGLFRKKFTPYVCILILVGLSFAFHFLWVHSQQRQFQEVNGRMRQYIETTIGKDQRVSSEEIQNILRTNARVALFVWENQLEKRQLGFLNVKCFDLGAFQLAAFYNQHTTAEVLEHIIQNPQEFSNPYLQIREEPVFRIMNNQKVKIGQYAIGYLLPGYLPITPKSGSYYDIFYKGWMVFLLSNMMIYPILRRRRKNSFLLDDSKRAKDHLEWLEQDLNAADFEEDTTRDSEFQSKPGWTELFNQSDLKDWNVKGEWYARDQAAIGFPWGGSITTKYEIPFEKYEFEVEGQRMVGGEGFSVLFQSQGKQLVWIIGGWKNSRSEVMGYEHTKTPDTLEKFRWYYVKIESDAEKLVGFLDGRKIWEILKKDVIEPTVDLGFQKGFGVGVWSSMARFQRIRMISTE